MVELYEPVAEEAGVDAGSRRSRRLVTVDGNRELIAQARVEPRRQRHQIFAGDGQGPRRKSSSGWSRQAGDVMLRVADNGPGIPDDEDRKRVTERFVRLEKSRSQPGSGLGLQPRQGGG